MNVLLSILVRSDGIKLYTPADRNFKSIWLWVVFITVVNTLTVLPEISTNLILASLFVEGYLRTAISIVGFGNILNSIELLFDGPFIPVTVLNVNPGLIAVPPGVVTLTLPDAPVPTTAVMLVTEKHT